MSPEQVQGRDVDARSDLYSLAVVLFELVTGRVPFAEGTDFEIMKAQIEAPPPPLRQLVGDVPPVLENILSRALAKDPAQRYPDANAFRRAGCRGFSPTLRRWVTWLPLSQRHE
ncbi:MAG: protein kinase [Candidatus Accumulibacter sp.]|uniref:mitogen-activated protein kinase kinase n=1 Tax=Candidatus Accumulibacter proximus TaxID=2954385 RepID=A0A935PYW4_9PROT|nr:protein kinase [Candidatus Accumulibacter proximus]